MYSVNNIEDIDPEKKKKQESLMEHISELKSSIKTADEFLSANQEKYQKLHLQLFALLHKNHQSTTY